MHQSHINEAFTKLKTSGENKPLVELIDEFEKLFELSHFYPSSFHHFLKELLKTTFWQSHNYPGNPYPELCLALTSCIDNLYNAPSHTEPPYHSRNHFQDVCVALTVLLDQSPVSSQTHQPNDPWILSSEEAWLLLFCAIAHDYDHNGSINHTPFELELLSINKTFDFLTQSSLPPPFVEGLEARVKPIILATDPAFMGSLLSRFNEPTNEITKVDCLSMLMVEADILASALPIFGKLLGNLLGQEWTFSNPNAASAVISSQGRLRFLENIRFLSPHAAKLKIEQIRKNSIRQLKE